MILKTTKMKFVTRNFKPVSRNNTIDEFDGSSKLGRPKFQVNLNPNHLSLKIEVVLRLVKLKLIVESYFKSDFLASRI